MSAFEFAAALTICYTTPGHKFSPASCPVIRFLLNHWSTVSTDWLVTKWESHLNLVLDLTLFHSYWAKLLNKLRNHLTQGVENDEKSELNKDNLYPTCLSNDSNPGCSPATGPNHSLTLKLPDLFVTERLKWKWLLPGAFHISDNVWTNWLARRWVCNCCRIR